MPGPLFELARSREKDRRCVPTFPRNTRMAFRPALNLRRFTKSDFQRETGVMASGTHPAPCAGEALTVAEPARFPGFAAFVRILPLSSASILGHARARSLACAKGKDGISMASISNTPATWVTNSLSPRPSKPLTPLHFRPQRASPGLGLTTLWALAKAKRIAVVRVGRRTLIHFASLEHLLAPGTSPPANNKLLPRRRHKPSKASRVATRAAMDHQAT